MSSVPGSPTFMAPVAQETSDAPVTSEGLALVEDIDGHADTGNGNRFRNMLLDRDQLRSLPKPTPLIEDTIDQNTVALLAGYWGTGKSFVAQDWGACVATGRAWMGRPSAPGRVLYVAAEGAYGLDERITAWETAWQATVDRTQFVTLPLAPNLGANSDVNLLCEIVSEFTLVIIDTIAKCAVGLDENSARDMGIVVSNLYRVQQHTMGGTVIGVHHTGKDRITVRGSSALEGGVDTVYITEGDVHALKLSRTKRKEGPRDDVHQLKLDQIPGTDSAVLVRSVADMAPRAQELMSAFMSAFSETGCTKADLRGVAGMSPQTFHRSVNSLVNAGVIKNFGTDQRPFYRLVGNS